jgi:biofilm PGA synthesis lipoprotein PgaB
MKKVLSLIITLLLVLCLGPINNVSASNVFISIIYPLPGDTISIFQSIIVKINRKLGDIKPYLCILDEEGKIFSEKLSYDSKIWFYNWDTRKFRDGNYFLFAYIEESNRRINDSEVVNVIVNNSILSINAKIEPSLARSGMKINLSLSSSVYLSNVVASFEEGLRIYLDFLKDQNLWVGSYNIPPTISEGSHIVSFDCIDSNGNTVNSKASFMVCNSEPVISFPKSGAQIVKGNISLKGLFKPLTKVYIYHNNRFAFEATADLGGYWEVKNITLIEGRNTFSAYSSRTDEDLSVTFPTQKVDLDYLKGGLIVLTYHNISDSDIGLFNRTSAQFRDDLNYLLSNGYEPVSPALFISFLDGKAKLPDKSVILTFDDGLVSVYKNAYPILRGFGFSGLFFVIVSRVGLSDGYVNWQQLIEMQSSRILSIESHTYNSHYMVNEKEGTHAALTSRIPLPDGSLENYENYFNRVYEDLKTSKEILEENLNKKVQFLSVPFGSANKEVKEISRKLGFKAIFSSDGGVNKLPLEEWNIKRVTVTRDTKLSDILF